MVDGRYLAMLYDIQSFESSAKPDNQALKPKAYSEDRKYVVLAEIPNVFDNPDILVIYWRAWSWSNNDSGEMAEYWSKLIY